MFTSRTEDGEGISARGLLEGRASFNVNEPQPPVISMGADGQRYSYSPLTFPIHTLWVVLAVLQTAWRFSAELTSYEGVSTCNEPNIQRSPGTWNMNERDWNFFEYFLSSVQELGRIPSP